MGDVLVSVQGMEVLLPDGTIVVAGTDVTVRAGEVVSLLGPSGAGKTTLLRAIFSPDDLLRRGYGIQWSTRELHAEPAYVPQRGALFDHLDVAGNVALAQEAGGQSVDVGKWLGAVDLDPSIAEPGRSVAALSGGQAQRVAIARTLAAGRRLLVLDEPSVGLDPLGVRLLAQLLVKEAREQQIGVIVITHDVAFAAGASDAVLFLDTTQRKLVHVREGVEPAELKSASERNAEVERLYADLERMLSSPRPPMSRVPGVAPRRHRPRLFPSVLRAGGGAIARLFQPRLMRASMVVYRRALAHSLVRPLPFYLVVGALLGFTVLYVIAKMTADVRAAAMLRLVGGTYILALAPPLSAILFAATSGNAVNAWLGSMQLSRQVLAMEGLGIPQERYLWAPAWLALVTSYLLSLVGFVAAMTFGGWVLCRAYGVSHAVSLLTSDFLDPAPGRVQFLVRAVWLVFAYAGSIASIVVARGVRHKDEAGDVTGAMTSAVIVSTLLVVVLELASVVVLFALQRH